MVEKHFVQILGIRAHLFKEHIQAIDCKVEIIKSPQELSPNADICIVSGLRYIIEPKYLHIPRLGIWGFHESPLPKGKGWAPIHWTVLNKEKELVVSFFELIEKVDEGRLLGQERCLIPKNALLEDLRFMATNLSKTLIDKYLIRYLAGEIHPHKQSGEATYYRRRTMKDSQLDTAKTLGELWDFIRICDNDEYPAWFEVDGEKFILKCYRLKDEGIGKRKE